MSSTAVQAAADAAVAAVNGGSTPQQAAVAASATANAIDQGANPDDAAVAAQAAQQAVADGATPAAARSSASAAAACIASGGTAAAATAAANAAQEAIQNNDSPSAAVIAADCACDAVTIRGASAAEALQAGRAGAASVATGASGNTAHDVCMASIDEIRGKEVVPASKRIEPTAVPTPIPTATTGPTYTPGFSVVPSTYTVPPGGIPAEVGCVYFTNAVPKYAGQVVLMVTICSCSPLGVLSFSAKSIHGFGLLNDQMYSIISYIQTGPKISISIYTDKNFQSKKQLTIGPSLQMDLTKVVRQEANGFGVIDPLDVKGGVLPTWDRMLYSFVLNAWCDCIIRQDVPIAAPQIPVVPGITAPAGVVPAVPGILSAPGIQVGKAPAAEQTSPAAPAYVLPAPGGAAAAEKYHDDIPPAPPSDDTPVMTMTPTSTTSPTPLPGQPTAEPTLAPVFTSKPTYAPIKINAAAIFKFNIVTGRPIADPTFSPTAPSPEPTYEPTYEATLSPTPEPSVAVPTPEPTEEPTPEPTPAPSVIPGTPTAAPTMAPTFGDDVKICRNSYVKSPENFDLTKGLLAGCAAFLLNPVKDLAAGITGAAPMTTICTCDLVGPIFLQRDDMARYGMLGDNMAGMVDALATGLNVSVTLYDEADFSNNANKYVVGPQKQLLLGDLAVGAQPGINTPVAQADIDPIVADGAQPMMNLFAAEQVKLRKEMDKKKMDAESGLKKKSKHLSNLEVELDADHLDTMARLQTEMQKIMDLEKEIEAKQKASASKSSASASASAVKPAGSTSASVAGINAKVAEATSEQKTASSLRASSISTSTKAADKVKPASPVKPSLVEKVTSGVKSLLGIDSKAKDAGQSTKTTSNAAAVKPEKGKEQKLNIPISDDDLVAKEGHDDVNMAASIPMSKNNFPADDDAPYDDANNEVRDSWKSKVKSLTVMAWIPCRPPDNLEIRHQPCDAVVTQAPQYEPTPIPTLHPQAEPTFSPTPEPTFEPTFRPSAAPSKPTLEPTYSPVPLPTPHPTNYP